MKMTGLVLGALLFGTGFSPLAFGHGDTSMQGLRLIQTDEHTRQWLNSAEIAELSRKTHATGKCGGFMDVTDHPVKSRLWLKPVTTVENLQLRNQALVNRLKKELSADNLQKTVQKLSSYKTRENQSSTGVQSMEWIRDQFLSMSKGRADVSVRMVKHHFKQPSVVATIQGNGPKAAETVIVGGHGDSINQWGFFPGMDKAPGADDNASGTATVLETFRVLMDSDFKPSRTLEFMVYAGEEKGLLGSQDIAEQYQHAGRQIAGVLQFDMTMYPGPGREIILISDHTDKGLTEFLKVLIDAYVGVPWREDECGYACSDHASWDALGYPAAFPFEAMFNDMNPKIHSADDVIEELDMSFGLHYAKLGLAFAIEMSKN